MCSKLTFSLDIDETLVHTLSDMSKYKKLKLYSSTNYYYLRDRTYKLKMIDVSSQPGNGIIHEMHGVFRPYLREFLKFLEFYSSGVIIWSAGQYKYVHQIVDLLFPGDYQPNAVYTYEDCIIDNSNVFSPETTLHVDDRKDTFSKNNGNGIHIPVYNIDDNGVETYDIALVQLMYWLQQPHVINCTDVTKLDKSKIFKQKLSNLDIQKVLNFGKSECTVTTTRFNDLTVNSIIEVY